MERSNPCADASAAVVGYQRSSGLLRPTGLWRFVELTRVPACSKRRPIRLVAQAAEQAGRVGSAMAYNFRACDRDQAFLLPPDLREWLPADHLAWSCWTWST